MSGLGERLLGEWSSPTTAIKKRLFRYCLYRYFPLILPFSTSLELELLNGYARLENIHLDPSLIRQRLIFLNEGAEIESVIVEEVQVWIAWDKVLAMYDPEYDLRAFDVATVTIQAKGVKTVIKWESTCESIPEPEALKASIFVVRSEAMETSLTDDSIGKRMQGSLESIPEEEDEESGEWMKRILKDMQVNVEDITISVNELMIHLASFEFTMMESTLSGVSVNCGDDVIVELVERMTLREGVIDVQSLHLHLHPFLAAFTGLIQIGAQQMIGNAHPPQVNVTDLHVIIHAGKEEVRLSGSDASLSFDGLRIRDFRCLASGLIVSGDPFTITKQDAKSFEVSPMKVCIEPCFLDTLHSFTESWMNLGGYKRDALNITCSKLDLTIATHAMMIEQVGIVLSSSIKASIKSVKSEDFILTCIKANFKQTLKKSTLNLSAFYPHGHFPFDGTKVMLEDTPFLKCPLSNIALFQKLAERSQRVLEVTVEGIEVLRDVMPVDFHSHTISNDSNHPATLILIKVDNIVIHPHDSRFKHLFLAYFVNDQLALGDLRVDIVSCRYSNILLKALW